MTSSRFRLSLNPFASRHLRDRVFPGVHPGFMPLSEFEITPRNPGRAGLRSMCGIFFTGDAFADLEATQTRVWFWSQEEAGILAALPKTHMQLTIRPGRNRRPGCHISCLVCPEPRMIRRPETCGIP